jgi:adenylate kinase family enzyme
VSNENAIPCAKPDRIVIQGASGSGKTTLARELARSLDVPYLELDSIYHQEHWTPLDVEAFRERVSAFADQPRWVSDGNYRAVRDVLWRRANVIVFIDLPRRHVIARLLKRTIRRGVRREELWNGNRELLRHLISRNPDINVVLWSWKTHARYHEIVPSEARTQAPHAEVTVLVSPTAVTSFLQRLGAP